MVTEIWSHDRSTSAAFLREMLRKSCPFTKRRRSPNLQCVSRACESTEHRDGGRGSRVHLSTPSAGLPLAMPVTTMDESLGKYSEP